MQTPLFEVVTTTAGAVSIRNNAVNEIMHNPVGPWVEANLLYIDQSDLRRRLQDKAAGELVIFDVGLGAASNALAALACAKDLGLETRPMRIVSFERDLDLLRFALLNSDKFSHFHGFEKIVESLLANHSWSEGSLSWDLREGNFLEQITSEPYRPHLIFFDPYSPKVNNEMWTTDCFRKLRLKSREGDEGGTALYTYSRATRIRVAMIEAGFCVGHGTATGMKDETTEAATVRSLLKAPLGTSWLEKWRRSSLRYPYDCLEGNQAKLDALIEKTFSDIK